MAKRLNMFIADYVHVNQSGFIPGRHISDNIRTTLDVVHYGRLKKLKVVMAALDAEKAFDHLESFFFYRYCWHI